MLAGARPLLGVATVAARRRPDVSLEWVTVGDPGNAPDGRVATCCHEEAGASGFGAVDHAYRIGKFEVTNEGYAAFLNAVGRSDPHGLFNPFMREIARPPRCPKGGRGPCRATDVGAYANAPSPYGTFDQCGNHIELTETPAARPNSVIVRGGGYTRATTDAAAFGRNHARAAWRGCWGLGFRLAAPLP